MSTTISAAGGVGRPDAGGRSAGEPDAAEPDAGRSDAAGPDAGRSSDAGRSDAGGSAMDDEFEVLPRWTADAVRRLGADHAIPAACRGSASPSALTWLGEACELAAGSVLVDVGGGMGGPAAFAAERYRVRPILLEPMPGACRAAVRLFGPVLGSATLVAAGDRLPLAPGSADAAWCLGVLCTTGAKAELLAEVRRVLRPGAALGLFVLLADQPRPLGAPEGNLFPSEQELADLLSGAGFQLVERRPTADFGAAPRSWTDRADRVEQAVARAHDGDARLAASQDQEQRLARLMDDGTVTGHLLHATAR